MSIALYKETAFQCSKLVTRAYSTSFSVGVRLLDTRYRAAIYAIYGYVRYADEVVDTFHAYDKEVLLARFRTDTYRALAEGISLNPIIQSFAVVVREYAIEPVLLDAFLDSMAMDLTPQVYLPDAYHGYIYGSAEVVGLMCLRVFTAGDQTQYAWLQDPARRLGAAFQKVNFLRDMASDHDERGRLYFPGIDFHTFSPADKREIEAEIQEDFTAALAGLVQLPRGVRLGVYVAYRYYVDLFAHLRKESPQALLTKRVRVSNSRKLWLLVQSAIRHYTIAAWAERPTVLRRLYESLLFILMVGWTGLTPAAAHRQETGDSLRVTVTGLVPGRGNVLIALYDRAATFGKRDQVREGRRLPVSATSLLYTFTNLPDGQYAVAAVYDLNRNGKLDTGLFGIPKEPYGFSNNAQGQLGLPSFDKAKVTVVHKPAFVTIPLR